MSSTRPPTRLHPAHALGVYAEPLATGRRVVLVGDSSQEVAAVLAEAGARAVHVYDPNRERARDNAGTSRTITVRELPAEFEMRDGAFDLAVVPDLAAIPDPPGLLARLRRLVGPDGAVLVAAQNPDFVGPGPETIDYSDLYDMVSMQFEHVRMIGQIPFAGVTLAELGLEGDPEVSVDTRLGTEDKTPHAFLALGSQHDAVLAPYALVELPTAPVVVKDDAPLRAALAEARLKVELFAAQLEESRTATQRAASDAEAARARRVQELEGHLAAVEARAGEHFVRAERLAQEATALEEEVTRLRGRSVELEQEVMRLQGRGVELEEQTSDYKRMRAISEIELTAARASISELEERLGAYATELEAARNAVLVPAIDAEAVARLAERADQAERALETIAQLESDLVNAGELHSGELGQIESLLRERGKTIKHLEHEIVRRERLVKELVAALEEARHAPGAAVAHEGPSPEVATLARENQALRHKLDELALAFARQKGDAQAQEWKLSELEQRLAMAAASAPQATPAAPAPAAAPDADSQALRAELDALRQAMAQEHEARVRAESGEALTKAQTELARQATLIEQLSRELEAMDTRGRPRPERLAD
jgi:SAM-dependent methyltransferase